MSEASEESVGEDVAAVMHTSIRAVLLSDDGNRVKSDNRLDDTATNQPTLQLPDRVSNTHNPQRPSCLSERDRNVTSMDRLHARYPFFAAAREAVDAADVDLGELVARDDDPAVDRAVERVTTALTEHTTGEMRRDPRTELLSYPVARVIVSLVDDHVVTRTYALAEAATAHERVVADLDTSTQLKSTSGSSLTVDRLLDEFDLADSVTSTDEGYQVAVGPYLRLTGDRDDDAWRLPRRSLVDGMVPVTRTELLTLLRGAIEERVAAGLPFDVPEPIGAHLDDEVGQIEDVLSDPALPTQFGAVQPDLFPPCVAALLDRARDGEDLPAHSWFTLTAFCATVGLSAEELVAIVSADDELAERIRYQMGKLASEKDGIEYPPASCATIQTQGDCVNQDEVCAEISHPLAYYKTRVDASSD
ncbi:DNA primase regulatory subunit PriL [Haloarchaeobius sp. DFWS5]|uniref:DNA primase regulatory subunit PriL n=1 Tax=Haloarchaeobius sp. DFWS5 TaxID=3446114 RepID=UPI003EC116C0